MSKLFTILIMLNSGIAICQVRGIGISPNGSSPDSSAMLDVSSTTKGELIPRMSKAQRNAINNPALSLVIYDTTTHCFETYGYGNWQTLSCLCTGPPSAPAAITGITSPCANEANLVFSVPLVLNVTSYTWTVPADAVIIAGQGSNSITINFGVDTGSITVTANNACGSSAASALHINIASTPSVPGNISGNAYPCANSSAQPYSVPAVSGATSYNWQAPSGATVIEGQGTLAVLINFSSTPGNISVTASNACGSSGASILAVSMPSVAPTAPDTIYGDSTFTANQSGVVYHINPLSNANLYTWSVPADASITSGQGTDSITVVFGTHSGNICVTASNCVGSSSNCFTVHNNCYSPGSITFNCTNTMQTFTVPCGVPWVFIKTYGAQGGGTSCTNGALGGSVSGILPVTVGQVLYVFVGGQNGYNGGGTGNGSSNGGGMSDVRVGGMGFNNWVIVAGGGGGGGDNDGQFCTQSTGTGGGGVQCANGAGGGGGGNYTGAEVGYLASSQGGAGTCTLGGVSGTVNQHYCGGSGGGGGLTGGGAGGISNGYGNPGSAGTQGQGGNYGPLQYFDGGAGGGGGGYYGGGGAASSNDAGGGGGGGSSWASSIVYNLIFTGGVQFGNGQVVITW